MKKHFLIGMMMLLVFVFWTVAVCIVDVRPIGPQGSEVGMATLNWYIHHATGVHPELYVLTDILSIIPISVAVGFGIFGLLQWIKRKSVKKVDKNILALGAFYAAVFAVFIFFELCIVNYRPVLIEENLEASYPSSTTMLVLCIIPTAIMQFDMRIKYILLKKVVNISALIFAVLMLILRFISGVHWFTDIIGGILLSAGFVMMYYSVIKK